MARSTNKVPVWRCRAGIAALRARPLGRLTGGVNISVQVGKSTISERELARSHNPNPITAVVDDRAAHSTTRTRVVVQRSVAVEHAHSAQTAQSTHTRAHTRPHCRTSSHLSAPLELSVSQQLSRGRPPRSCRRPRPRLPAQAHREQTNIDSREPHPVLTRPYGPRLVTDRTPRPLSRVVGSWDVGGVTSPGSPPEIPFQYHGKPRNEFH